MALLGGAAGGERTGRRQLSIGGRTITEVKQFAEGGFASVWRAEDASAGEAFALKKIVCPDRKSLAKALREAELLETLPAHPNVVRFFGHSVSDRADKEAKEVALLFELCSGGHLLDLLEQHQGRLTEEQVLKAFTDSAAGVAFLHGQTPPLQHRDLKVENVLLSLDGRFKLCDFGSWSNEYIDPSALDKRGLADLEEEIEKHTTLMYRPPEMVNFFKQFAISVKVDLWMLGCILFTLMFYRNPFQGQSPLAIANARFDFPAPQSGPPRFSERLYDLVRWLLAQDPDDRPSASQLLDLLLRFPAERDEPLPLPKAVVERKEHCQRLYNPQAGGLVSEARHRRHKGEKSSEEKSRHRSAKHRERAGTADSILSALSSGWTTSWGLGDVPCREQQEPQMGENGWPAAASSVPDPAKGWADFGAFGEQASPAWPPAADDDARFGGSVSPSQGWAAFGGTDAPVPQEHGSPARPGCGWPFGDGGAARESPSQEHGSPEHPGCSWPFRDGSANSPQVGPDAAPQSPQQSCERPSLRCAAPPSALAPGLHADVWAALDASSELPGELIETRVSESNLAEMSQAGGTADVSSAGPERPTVGSPPQPTRGWADFGAAEGPGDTPEERAAKGCNLWPCP